MNGNDLRPSWGQSDAKTAILDGELYRIKDVERPIDDGTGKPEHVWMRTGRKPLLACGNADGDVPMLKTARSAS